MLITTNFDSTEFQTDKGELNLDTHHILTLQAFRSWLGLPVIVVPGGGCRYPKWDAEKGKWKASAHDIYMPKSIDSEKMLTLPATGSDIAVEGFDSWQLMDKVEEFENKYKFPENDTVNLPEDYNIKFGEGGFACQEEWFTELLNIKYPLWTGRGVYNKSNNGFVHLDVGHRSLNPRIRAKRTDVTRWLRIKDVYRVARPGESFAELRERVA